MSAAETIIIIFFLDYDVSRILILINRTIVRNFLQFSHRANLMIYEHFYIKRVKLRQSMD